jgi:hypothetical protein
VLVLGVAVGSRQITVVVQQTRKLLMNAGMPIFAFSLLAGVSSTSVRATDHDYHVDFPSSQAILRAIEACRSEKCDLSKYQFSTEHVANGIVVSFMPKDITAEQLFAGDYEDVTERHYLIDPAGRAIVKRWYGK